MSLASMSEEKFNEGYKIYRQYGPDKFLAWGTENGLSAETLKAMLPEYKQKFADENTHGVTGGINLDEDDYWSIGGQQKKQPPNLDHILPYEDEPEL